MSCPEHSSRGRLDVRRAAHLVCVSLKSAIPVGRPAPVAMHSPVCIFDYASSSLLTSQMFVNHRLGHHTCTQLAMRGCCDCDEDKNFECE